MATGRAIDHVVLAVRDLDRAAARYEQLGFTLTPRASHEDRVLAPFGAKGAIHER
jgi:catechol 2,3-dioxygenase-like lactoylglutathione lyase family enzyme